MTTPTPTTPPSEKPAGPTLESWLTALREGITGCLGLLIVLTTLALVLATFILLLLRPSAEFAPLRDILVMLNGMAGVVLGYYFGRIPAEIRANKAETERASAEKQVTTETAKSATLRAGLRGLEGDLDRQAQLAPTAPVAKGLAPAPNPLVEMRDRARRILDETS